MFDEDFNRAGPGFVHGVPGFLGCSQNPIGFCNGSNNTYYHCCGTAK